MTQFQAARRLDGVSESATLKLNAMVQALKASGVDVVNLTAGEPDFPVFEAAKKAVREALDANRSKYTPVPGIPELRTLVAKKTNLQQPALSTLRPWKAENVVVSNGGKQAIFNTLMALVNPGDEVLIPSPYWLSYPEMTKLVGGIAQFMETTYEGRFKITPELLNKTLSHSRGRARILILNSPSNPTGAMYSKEEFVALGKVLREHPAARDLWIISDEIYDRIVLSDVPFCSFLEACPELSERTVTVNGLSKSGAMTGWRVGWSVAPLSLTQAIGTFQGQSTSGINALAQWASVAVLALPESAFEEQTKIYRSRRQIVLEALEPIKKLQVFRPDGAFYVFLGVGHYLKSGEDSLGFAERLLEGAKVAVVPGTPFGRPDFLRLSFATDEKSLAEGCKRIGEFLK